MEQNQDGTTGGSHVSLLHHVSCLDKRLYQAVVMFYESNDMLNLFKQQGAEIHVFLKPPGINLTAPMPIFRPLYKTAQKIRNAIFTSLFPFLYSLHFLVKEQIDLVHLNNTASAGWEWLLACKLLKIKCVTHERGFARYTRVAKYLAHHFDCILCVSEAVRTSLLQQGITANLKTLHNAIDLDVFRGSLTKDPSDVKKEFNLPPSAQIIGMIANIQEWKGHRTVLEALRILRRDFPDLHCLFVGGLSPIVDRDQAFFADLKRYIEINDLHENVTFTGFRNDIPDLMNAMDVVLHASLQPEPFGRVLIEAMALEKPVIATDIGGPKEIIEDGVSGYLLPPADPVALAHTIKRLITDPALRAEIGNNALRNVNERFTLTRYSDRIHSIYREIFPDGSARPRSGS